MSVMTKQFSSGLTATVLSLVVVLGGWMWYLQPERGAVWAITMFMLPAAWGSLVILKRMGAFRSTTRADAYRIRRALAGAGLIVAAALGASLAKRFEFIGSDGYERVMGLVIGGMLVVIGNALPKTLEPMTERGCEPSSKQSLQRFAGWMFVLAGLAYAVVWFVLPVGYAGFVATAIVAAATVLVIGRMAWLYLQRTRP